MIWETSEQRAARQERFWFNYRWLRGVLRRRAVTVRIGRKSCAVPAVVADELYRIRSELADVHCLADDYEKRIARLESTLEAARKAWSDSAAFDNYECDFGPTLGTCPESNNCWQCRLHNALYPGKMRDGNSPCQK